MIDLIEVQNRGTGSSQSRDRQRYRLAPSRFLAASAIRFGAAAFRRLATAGTSIATGLALAAFSVGAAHRAAVVVTFMTMSGTTSDYPCRTQGQSQQTGFNVCFHSD